MDKPLLIALDTASLYFRAFFGVPQTLRSGAGEPVNAAYGLLDMIATLVGGYQPAALACAWDNDWRPPWRTQLVPSYKLHRVAPVVTNHTIGAGGVGAESGLQELSDPALAAQVPWIRELLAALRLPVLGVDGFEADDVLASLTRRGVQAGFEVVVVTGDRDLFQLVGADCRVAYVAKGVRNHELVDDAWLAARYGVIGAQYADFATLRGDASDGLPGVAGVGEKTAASLLARWGDLDGVLAAAEDPASGLSPSVLRKLQSARDYLESAGQVVRCVDDLELGELLLGLDSWEPDVQACERLGTHLGLQGPLRRLIKALQDARQALTEQ